MAGAPFSHTRWRVKLGDEKHPLAQKDPHFASIFFHMSDDQPLHNALQQQRIIRNKEVMIILRINLQFDHTLHINGALSQTFFRYSADTRNLHLML